jgi:hypothetical protein
MGRGRRVSQLLAVAKAVYAMGHSRAGKVVPVGNIARFSLGLRWPGKRLPLQTGHMVDNDPDAAFASGGRP